MGRHGHHRRRHTVSAIGGTISADGLVATFSADSATMTVVVTPLVDAVAERTESVTVAVASSSPTPSCRRFVPRLTVIQRCRHNTGATRRDPSMTG